MGMTREEAIKIVNELQDTYIKYRGEEDAIEVLIDSVDIEALDMAIKALEQDTVSKESYDHEYFLRRKMEAEIDHLRRYISKLETQITLEQERTTKNDLGVDCIDRQATLDAIIKRLGIKNETYLLEAERVIYQQILAMSPVTPQEPRKGEWLRMSDLPEQDDYRYKCSCCGNVINHKSKIDLYTFNSWCGRCGSDNGRRINYEVEE